MAPEPLARVEEDDAVQRGADPPYASPATARRGCGPPRPLLLLPPTLADPTGRSTGAPRSATEPT